MLTDVLEWLWNLIADWILPVGSLQTRTWRNP